MQEVMKQLEIDIPTYDRLRDPIFRHATWLHPGEEHTTSQPELDSPIKREACVTSPGEPPLKKEKRDELSSDSCPPVKKEEEDVSPSLVEIKEEAMEIEYGPLNLVIKQEEIICQEALATAQLESEAMFVIEETVVGCEVLKRDPAKNRIRREDTESPCKNKENRDVPLEDGKCGKGAKERTSSKMDEKENCSEDRDELHDDDAVKGSKSSGVQPDSGVLRNLQVEHNYSKSCAKEDNVGSESLSDSAPTRTSNRVREKRSMALAAAQKPKKEEPPKPAPKSQSKDKDKITKADYEIKVTKCSFCLELYLSPVCLFYPSFNTEPRKFEGCICECCDYSDSEEEVEEEEEELKESRGSDNGEEQTSKAQVINPGWYGKGYRRRKKRK